MEMKGEKIIKTSRERVWEALNDPNQLLKAIPGAQSVEKIDDVNLTATVKTKIGPISAKFNGKIKLSDIDPPNSYKLTGEGTGGAAGFAKGQAEVNLSDQELEDRRVSWKPRQTQYTSGALHKFTQLVGPARDGAVTHPGANSESHTFVDL